MFFSGTSQVRLQVWSERSSHTQSPYASWRARWWCCERLLFSTWTWWYSPTCTLSCGQTYWVRTKTTFIRSGGKRSLLLSKNGARRIINLVESASTLVSVVGFNISHFDLNLRLYPQLMPSSLGSYQRYKILLKLA